MKFYKGFDHNLQCRGFQYEVGQTYTEDEAVLCEKGFHACSNPNDILNYYIGRYCEVELTDPVSSKDGDSKAASKQIKIVREFSLDELIKVCFEFNKGLKLESQASGDYGHSQASGYRGHSQASGYGGHSQTSGYRGHSQASGYGGHSQTSGSYGHSQASGDYGHSQASGDYGHSQASGDHGHSQASGNYGHSQTSGENSVACSVGINSTVLVKKKGSVIFLVEYDDEGNIIGHKSGMAGKDIKCNVKYKLINNEFVECND